MVSVLVLTLNNYIVTIDLDILRVGNYRKSQVFCDLRSYLCGITIDCLTAGDDQIVIQIAECTCDCGGGSPCISSA